MEIQLTKGTWSEVENLTDDKTYCIEGKFIFEDKYYPTQLLLTQADTKPQDASNEGFIGELFKIKKVSGLGIYVKAISTQTILTVQEVQ